MTASLTTRPRLHTALRIAAAVLGVAAQHGGGDAQRGVQAGTGGEAGGHAQRSKMRTVCIIANKGIPCQIGLQRFPIGRWKLCFQEHPIQNRCLRLTENRRGSPNGEYQRLCTVA